MSKAVANAPILTPDGRYIVVRGRLWRASDPNLSAAERETLVAELMQARGAVRDAKAIRKRLRWPVPASTP